MKLFICLSSFVVMFGNITYSDTAPKQEAPQFMKKIGDCEIYAGMTAKFTACASGYPEPEYEWFCDTVRLHPSNRTEMEKEGTGLVRYHYLSYSNYWLLFYSYTRNAL